MQLPATIINSKSKIVIQRLLPTPGEVLVQAGQPVEALTVVARAQLPSRYRVIDVARQLARPRLDMDKVLQVEAGDMVEANQVIAAVKGGLPFLQRAVRAPAAGHIAVIGPGWVLLETGQTTTDLQAFINGVVTRIIPNRGVIIEAEGAMIEAACGFGGEAYGRLKRLVNSPYEPLEASAIDENVREAILLGGRAVDEDAVRQAEEWQARGIIVGSIQASLLNLDPPVKVRVVATEGFGDLAMSTYTFGILTSLSRRQVSIRGETPHLSPGHSSAGASPIIVATDATRTGSRAYTARPDALGKQPKQEVTVGSRVRITQGQALGTTGIIDSIPPQPQATESGIIAPGANVKFNNEVRYIPWVNLEHVL